MELKLKAGQFYGTTAQAVVANGFRFRENSYASQFSVPHHAHELSHFCFVLAGNYQEDVEGISCERAPSTLIFYPPDVSHAESHFDRGRHFLVEIETRTLQQVKDCGASFDRTTTMNSAEAPWLAARMYREFRRPDSFSTLVLESIATELLVSASRLPRHSERRAPSWLASVKECLHERFSEPPTLDELGRFVSVHPTHLARVFRQFERCTVGDYIREVRIQFARTRMLTSNESLVEIALAAGFADQTHFSRSFKRVTGMTPTDFRMLFAER